MSRELSELEIEYFKENGFILVTDLFESSKVLAALNAADTFSYGMPFSQYIANIQFDEWKQTMNLGNKMYQPQIPKFPTGLDEIDQLIYNDDFLNVYEQCLGTKARYCNAHLFVRSGPTDERFKPNPWEGYHIDHDTDSYLPPHNNWQDYAYVNCHIYLHDVDLNCAPMHIFPKSHLDVANRFSDYYTRGLLSDRGNFSDIRKLSSLNNCYKAVGKAGSALFYSSYLIHAAVPFNNRKLQRVFLGTTLVRQDNSSWKRFSWPYTFKERSTSNNFLAKTTPRFRTILGWPEPGHSYYNMETLALLEKWYPGIDLTPYFIER